MIYCIWYPSGGFGHFINALFSLYGHGFVRPTQDLHFSATGDSHSLDLIVPKYYKNQWLGTVDFDLNKNYSVLIDNGINDENEDFKNTFLGATTIKICYKDTSWPIVASTMLNKAMHSSVDYELTTEVWGNNEDWTKREKYFLFLRDHSLRHAWRPSDQNFLYVDDLINYQQLFGKLSKFIDIDPFEHTWKTWRSSNAAYIDPVVQSSLAIQCIKEKRSFDLTHVRDTWHQAVLYYYFWLEFGVEVPHNDFANWINNTDQLGALL